MSDLISREMAIAEAYAVIVDDAVYDVVQVETLEGLPTADAVEVVRCKNCRYWDKTKYADYATMGECMIWHTARNRKDYCSEGRKNGTDKSRRV